MPTIYVVASHLKRAILGDQRCPFLALWMPQGAAKTRKARHKAKAKIERFPLGEMRNPATSRNDPQRGCGSPKGRPHVVGANYGRLESIGTGILDAHPIGISNAKRLSRHSSRRTLPSMAAVVTSSAYAACRS
jgi:hypothetical protein